MVFPKKDFFKRMEATKKEKTEVEFGREMEIQDGRGENQRERKGGGKVRGALLAGSEQSPFSTALSV